MTRKYHFYDNKTAKITEISEDVAEAAVGERSLPRGKQYRRVTGGTVFGDNPPMYRKQKTNKSKKVRRCKK